ncbi:response regulator [Arenibaculum pallidiluteum]|uniref:response regulator n=1 Tax=Arenibaculum pallidiluteum TaxID=2812559 RepID=UPI001A977DAE|nr:response regulator [Arenibaculum pallidiluteum]
MNLMIVEDDAVTAMGMRDTLEAAGHKVVGVAGHVRAAARDARQGPDLALVDIGLLGHGDGAAFAATLWREHHVPVLFVTGGCPDRTAIRGWAVGCLSKPFSDAELVAAVDAVGRALKGEPPAAWPSALEPFEASEALLEARSA